MPHISETEFAESYAIPYLQDQFGTENVNLGGGNGVWLPHTGGYADAVVSLGSGPGVELVVEIGATDSIRGDCGQALEYAANSDRMVPYVIVPENHSEYRVVEAFRGRGVIVIELPTA